MPLDFTAINNIPFTGEDNHNRVDRNDDLVSPEIKKARKVYAEYQDAIKKSSGLKSDILKGIKAGEDPLSLLVNAMEVISLMTGNKAIYIQSREDIKAVYGWGLGESAPLEKEIVETKKRIQKMSDSLTGDLPEEAKKRIKEAIKEHEKYIKLLEDRIKSENK